MPVTLSTIKYCLWWMDFGIFYDSVVIKNPRVSFGKIVWV